MQNESRHKLEPIFHDASARAKGAERDAYLDGACGDDADLRTRVDALLAAHDAASGILDSPAVEGTREGPGATIGNYKLLQEIGEGGMGVVYMAEQERPVRRKVALKVIKLGMDTKQVIARFEAERQALAMMDHAHIARVLDAGATEAGRPYFVMELVRGVPINEYCDTHNLATDERLGLFVDVCRAVQHAHQKGVIHRDLKPTNVLVTSHDGKPVPKIIDFGVAKATNQRLTERTLFTEFHQIIGTPEYMSPEQAEMSGLDVDTRSDIYSLGVLLYQLLTGTTPVDPTDLRTAAFEEMTRMIREDEAPAPSTRISRLGGDAEKIAKQRRSDARTLSRDLRGDLDWIVMKALEKDRTRRYENASAFAEDVERHLESRPVEAGPPSATYRFAKFARRNRKMVMGALLLITAVGLGLAGTTAGFLSASAERDRSLQISDSLQDVLAMTDATSASSGSDIEAVRETVREVFGDDHATYAAVLNTLSSRLHDAGEFKTATELSRESLAIWKRISGDKHPNVGRTLASLGSQLRSQGEDLEAEQALREALSIFDGASEVPVLESFDTRIELSDLLSNRGEYTEARELLEVSLALLQTSPARSHFRIIETLERLAMVQVNQPDADLRETVRQLYDEVHEFYPDDSPLLAISALGYGRQLFEHGDRERAEELLRESIHRFRAMENPPSMTFLAASDLLFQILRGRSDEESVAEADDVLRDLIVVARTIWGPDNLTTNLKYYATRMADRGRHLDALDTMLDAHQVLVDAGYSVDERENVRDNMAMMAFRAVIPSGLEFEVYERAQAAIEIAIKAEPTHPAMQTTQAAVLYRLGDYSGAEQVLAQLTAPLSESRGGLARRMAPADHAFRAMTHVQLGDPETARSELALMRDAILDQIGTVNEPAILAEVEALVEPQSASNSDG